MKNNIKNIKKNVKKVANIKNVAKIKRLKADDYLTIMVLAVAILLIVGSYYLYNINVKSSLQMQTKQHLSEMTTSGTEYVNLKLSECFDTLEAMTEYIEKENTIKTETLDSITAHLKDYGYYDVIISVNDELYSMFDNTNEIRLNDSYYKNVEEGDRNVTNTQLVIDDINCDCILFTVPIYKDATAIGAVQAVFTKEELTNIIDISSFGQKGNTFIVKKDGTLITTGSASSNVKELSDIIPKNSKIVNTLKSSFLSRKSGDISYETDKNNGYIWYSRLEYGDWFAVSITSASVVEPQNDEIIDQGFLLSVRITGIFVMFLVFLMIKYIKNKLSNNLADMKYKIVAEQSDSIIFEYDIIDKTISYTDKWYEKFDIDLQGKCNSKKIIESGLIYSKDIEKFQNLTENMKLDVEDTEIEIRLISKLGNPIWCKIRSRILHSGNKQEKIIGKIIDINQIKQEIDYFKEMANIDQLTGLYNKKTAMYKMQYHITRRGQNIYSALIFFDIDDFKKINDTYGHVFGDRVIVAVGKKLLSIMKEDRFAARCGGDEFAVFLKSETTISNIETTVMKIIDEVKAISFEDNPDFKINISVGVAISPQAGNNYEELMEKADKAMYKSKEINDKYKYTIA